MAVSARCGWVYSTNAHGPSQSSGGLARRPPIYPVYRRGREVGMVAEHAAVTHRRPTVGAGARTRHRRGLPERPTPHRLTDHPLRLRQRSATSRRTDRRLPGASRYRRSRDQRRHHQALGPRETTNIQTATGRRSRAGTPRGSSGDRVPACTRTNSGTAPPPTSERPAPTRP